MAEIVNKKLINSLTRRCLVARMVHNRFDTRARGNVVAMLAHFHYLSNSYDFPLLLHSVSIIISFISNNDIGTEVIPPWVLLFYYTGGARLY